MASCRIEQEQCGILHVAALLERDTDISARQARSLGIDCSPDVGAFLPVWEAEEAEHTALRFLLAHQTYTHPQSRPKAIPLRRRRVARVPLRALRCLPQVGFVFCALGAAAEYVTIVTYSELAGAVEHPVAASLIHDIARQEGRHLAFFLAAARARGVAMSPASGRLARRALEVLWEPVGVPSLGLSAWRTIFARFLERDHLRTRVQVMDRVVDTIPHLAGLNLMSNFLRAHAPSP